MKIQNKLSLYSSIAFAVIFALLSLLIYFLYSSNAKKSIDDNLKITAQITAIFYLEEDELNKEEFAHVKKQFSAIVNNENYQIFNDSNLVSYGSDQFSVSADILNTIREKDRINFSEEDFYCYGIHYEDNQGNFVVIVRDKKTVLSDQLNQLIWILLLCFILSVVAIIFLSKWIARVAYKPFRQAIEEVNNITTENLDVQIASPQTKDELQDLIETFNALLSKISDTVSIQKNFARYVSHEFKTPLASIMGNLEVFSIKERTPKEYEELSDKLIRQIEQLEDIINALMVISDLKQASDSETDSFRIDELLFEIIEKVNELYKNPGIYVTIHVLPENRDTLIVHKDRTVILIALFNLIENAVKYASGNPVEIALGNENDCLFVEIRDNGIGIPPEKLNNINKPFDRAENASQIAGSGIGLSIALRILEKNHIKFSIKSKLNQGTTVKLVFSDDNNSDQIH